MVQTQNPFDLKLTWGSVGRVALTVTAIMLVVGAVKVYVMPQLAGLPIVGAAASAGAGTDGGSGFNVM